MSECASCKFWLKSTALIAMKTKEGDCRRNPPQAFIVPGPGGKPAVISSYSKTLANMWCGEFRSKDIGGSTNLFLREVEADQQPISEL